MCNNSPALPPEKFAQTEKTFMDSNADKHFRKGSFLPGFDLFMVFRQHSLMHAGSPII
jgi:hypothetical protein